MMWMNTLALLILGGAPGLEIVEPRATYGHLGAVRPKEGILPGDIAYFTFQIKGLKFDDAGLAKYSVAIEVKDEKGNLFYEQKPFNSIAQNLFGGDSLPVSAHVVIPAETPPGNLSWKVTVTDRVANKSVEQKGAGKVLPAALGLVRVGTFADPEDRVPTPPVGVVGSTIYLSFAAVGFGRDKKSGTPDLHVEMRILDEKKQPTMAKPLTGRVNEDIGATTRIVPLQFPLTLNRPGAFTVELSLRCAHSNETARITLPVRVLPME